MTTLPVLNPLGDKEAAGDRKLPAAAINCMWYYSITWSMVTWDISPFTNMSIFFNWLRADLMVSSTWSLCSTLMYTAISHPSLTWRTSITRGTHLLPVPFLNCTAACNTSRDHYIILISSVYFLQAFSFSTAYYRVTSVSAMHTLGYKSSLNQSISPHQNLCYSHSNARASSRNHSNLIFQYIG